MDWLRRRNRTHEDSLSKEIQDYLDRETQQNLNAGMAPSEARLAALIKLGR
jgi:hypothetical protein